VMDSLSKRRSDRAACYNSMGHFAALAVSAG
jgi:hypothetical protein